MTLPSNQEEEGRSSTSLGDEVPLLPGLTPGRNGKDVALPSPYYLCGAIPQTEDSRDYRIHFLSSLPLDSIPPDRLLLRAPSISLDYRKMFPPIFDQGAVGSCTANAGIALLMYVYRRQRNPTMVPFVRGESIRSRLFCYYNTRAIEGTTSMDSGASLRSTMKSLSRYGACLETEWSYSPSHVLSSPPSVCYPPALSYRIQKYAALDPSSKSQLIGALTSGFCFVFGMILYPSFLSPLVTRHGMVPVPDTSREQPIGGHALCCCGYHSGLDMFLVRNSWGTRWGVEGYCWIPSSMMTSGLFCFDLWTIVEVSSSPPISTRSQKASLASFSSLSQPPQMITIIQPSPSSETTRDTTRA